MSNTNNLTPAQRNNLFGQMTRRHEQMLGYKEVSGTNGMETLSFSVPKARLLSGIRLLVETVITVTGSGGSLNYKDAFSPYDVVKRVTLNLNNGFMPYVCSARSIAMVNAVNPHSGMTTPKADGTTLCTAPANIASSAGGTDTAISFYLELSTVLNERDPIGLYLAQNDATLIDFSVDIDIPSVIAKDISGQTFAYKSVRVTPCVSSFSIPADPRAFPDISVLKIVEERNETFSGGGVKTIILPVGKIYRKLLLAFVDDAGIPIPLENITSNIELSFNTADYPYIISPAMLRKMNMAQMGISLPAGVYVFDFSYQGIPNYGGSRDYIDTETLTEFALKFTCSTSGLVKIISESLARLIQTN